MIIVRVALVPHQSRIKAARRNGACFPPARLIAVVVSLVVLAACMAQPAPASAGEKIVFEAGIASDGNGGTVFAGEVGSNQYRLLHSGKSPALSADGQTVAFVDYPVSFPLQAALMTMPFDGGDPAVLRSIESQFGGHDVDLTAPNFSPNGRELVYGCTSIAPTVANPAPSAAAASGDCVAPIERIPSQGGGASPVVNEFFSSSPAYGIDGQHVFFARDQSPGKHLYSVTLAGDGEERITKASDIADADAPAVSPDGTRVAFEGRAQEGDALQIFVMDLAEGSVQQLTTSGGKQPSWRPDGQAIAYVNGGRIDEVSVATGNIDVLVQGPITVAGTEYANFASVAYRQSNTFDGVARKFRPNLFFDSSERFRPLNVNGFFAEQSGASPIHQVCRDAVFCLPTHEPDDLRFAPDANGRLEIGQVNGDYRSPNPDCRADGREDCNSGRATTLYYNLPVRTGAYQHVDYWWFYRFNDFPGGLLPVAGVDGGDHEGDWEGVTLAFSGGVSSDTFDYAQFSQHGNWVRYLRGTLQCDGQSDGSCASSTSARHLTVYAANGSHANYPRSCSAISSAIPSCGRTQAVNSIGFPIPIGEAGYDGSRAWGENGSGSIFSLTRFPTAGGWGLGQPRNWTDWPGKWSRTGGPSSPGSQPHFTDPGATVCAAEALTECFAPPPPAPQASQNKAVSDPRCAPWVGALVNAAICDAQQVSDAHRAGRLGQDGQFTITTNRPQSSAAAAPGIAQSLGQPLRTGDLIELHGARPSTAEIVIRARVAAKIYTLAFDQLPGSGTLRLDAPTVGSPVLVSSSGTIQRAIRVTAFPG